MSNYLGATGTAKLVRQALKEAFPGFKFSVRGESYSMGCCVNVRWTDGPDHKTVEKITRTFHGSYFDGMIDYKGSNYHLLDGEKVHFADSVSVSRDYSEAAEAAVKGAWEQLSVHERVKALEKLMDCHDGRLIGWANDECSYDPGWRQLLHHWNFYGEAKPCPTLDRITFYGDDGYGAGTVGTPEHPGGNDGYARAAMTDQERANAAAIALATAEAAAPLTREQVRAMFTAKDAVALRALVSSTKH